MIAHNKHINLIECPRDAMQGWHNFIPTAKKIEYINSLLKVGFDTLDFGSFVSSKAIPQMADTQEVLKHLQVGKHSNTNLLAIVANTRGAVEAMAYEGIKYIGFPFSISPTFQQKNTNSLPQESLQRIDEIQDLCIKNNKILVVYFSMAFGNPYNDEYNKDVLITYSQLMASKGIGIISLADTVGLGSALQIKTALATLQPQFSTIQFGVHLHCTASSWQSKLQAAIEAGCTRFDGALKGIGGCPMAQDNLVGNMDSINIINYFTDNKYPINKLNFSALDASIELANEIFV
jgi:hydroxymethylglutaryl-CoA lyase